MPRSWAKIAALVVSICAALLAVLLCAGGLAGVVALLQQQGVIR